jgi:hypothetical protein
LGREEKHVKTFGIIALVIIVLVFWLDRTNRARIRRLRESGEYPPPGRGTMADVERLVRLGRKIEAIKLYREIHGIDLMTAKSAVDAIVGQSEHN